MATQKMVITGVNGFVGKHLVRELKAHGIEVLGLDRATEADSEIAHELSAYISCDLSTSWPETGEVDGVIHLAGLAAVGPSFEQPQLYLEVNSAIMTHLAEYYLTRGGRPRIIVVSSGAIYSPHQTMPLNESAEIGYASPYAVSKVLVENQCAYYRNRGLDCVVARPFNHLGPGQRPGFLLPDLYEQIKSCLQTGASLKVGNLQTKRDYTDVRDVVRAYRLLATTPKLKNAVYNICSGVSHAGSELLGELLKACQASSLSTEVDSTKIRPNDPEDIVGDNTRLKQDTGWQPEIRLHQTIEDFVKAHTS